MSIGYACLTVGILNTRLSKCILKNITDDNLRRIILINLSALEKILDYNIKNKVKVFRISSDIIPFGSHEINKLKWWIEFSDSFKRLGEKIYSQQKLDGKIGSHSETVHIKEFMSFYENLEDKNIDIMLEVKNKNLSAIKCINCIIEKPSVRILEEEWAKYKYLVLSRSATIYYEIREMLKDKRLVKAKEFYLKIEEAFELKENIGAQVNAAEHIYGYVNKESTSAQNKRFHNLINSYKEGKKSIDALKNHLFKCAMDQKIDYLIHSYYFYV